MIPEGVVIFMLHAIQRMYKVAEAGRAGLALFNVLSQAGNNAGGAGEAGGGGGLIEVNYVILGKIAVLFKPAGERKPEQKQGKKGGLNYIFNFKCQIATP